MFENKNDDVMSELASTLAPVTASNWKEKNYSNASTAFSVPLYDDQHLNPSSAVSF